MPTIDRPIRDSSAAGLIRARNNQPRSDGRQPRPRVGVVRARGADGVGEDAGVEYETVALTLSVAPGRGAGEDSTHVAEIALLAAAGAHPLDDTTAAQRHFVR